MDIPTPNASEIDCLGALWRAQMQGVTVLRPCQIREAVNRRRSRAGQRPLAVSTISTVVRLAAAKGLLVEVRVNESPRGKELKRTGRSGRMRSRSPNTAYKARYTPSQVFRQTIKQIVRACPISSRALLVDELRRTLKASTKS
jgi:hypothetical protein